MQQKQPLLGKIKALISRQRSLAYICALLSGYTLIAFHYPFFDFVIENASSDWSGMWLICSLVIVMFTLNYLIYYLLLYLGRMVGKALIALTLVGNAIGFYFLATFHVLIDSSMMGNLFNTQFSEASSFLSWGMVWYTLLLGILPAALLLRKGIEYGSISRFGKQIGLSLLLVLVVVGSNYKSVFWIDRHAHPIGSKIMPWSYIVNSVRYYNSWKRENQKEILLPDVERRTQSKDICVLIIGESARSQNFSLYGYERETNPRMKAAGVTALKARTNHTNTLDAVKAMLQHAPTKELHEILPNYLNRNGVDVIWRTSNWGTPPIHVEKQYTINELQATYPEADGRYDGILFHGLREVIEKSSSEKLFIGIHTYTSHGPEYYSNSPDSLKRFMPECRTVEMANAVHAELINAYDNTIIYTDFLVHRLIELLKEFPDRRSCVLFVSDHGESLGEGGSYMHGLPPSVAPAEQLDIPFIVWTSENTELKVKELDAAGHHHIYHSVLHFLGLEPPFFDESKNIFEAAEQPTSEE